MSCAKAHHSRVGECPYCKIQELEKEIIELKRDAARYENARIITSNMLKDLNAQINLLKTERDLRKDQY